MTDHSSLGAIRTKDLNANNVKFFYTSGSNKATMALNGEPASDFTITLPSSSSTLATTDDLNDIELTAIDIQNATSESTPADSDIIPIFSNSNSANRGMTLSNLKNLSGIGLPSGSSNQLLIHNGSSFVSTDVSGDLTNSAGAFTIANDAVTNDKIADNAVDLNKCSFAPDTDGTSQANKVMVTDSSNNISSINDVGCANVEASTQVQCPIFEFGSGSTRWRMKMNASNALVMEVSTDSGSSYTTKHTFES